MRAVCVRAYYYYVLKRNFSQIGVQLPSFLGHSLFAKTLQARIEYISLLFILARNLDRVYKNIKIYLKILNNRCYFFLIIFSFSLAQFRTNEGK